VHCGCSVVEGVEGKATAPTTTALCFAPVGDLPNQTKPKHCEGKRCLFHPTKSRKGRPDRLSDDPPPPQTVEEATDASPWLPDCRRILAEMSHVQRCFNWVLGQTEDHEEFTTVGSEKKGRPQAPVIHQLMVFLKHIGTEGAGSNSRNQRQMFAISQMHYAKSYRNGQMRVLHKEWPMFVAIE